MTAKEKNIICAGKHVSKSCNAGRKCKNHIKIRLSCKSCYRGIWLSHRPRFGGAGGYAYKSNLRRNRHKSTGIKLRGNYVVISHSDNVETVYCHCKELFVSEGDIVSAGDIIALAGMTGQATGPHLHFELKINGLWCNPVWILDI